MQVPPSIGPWWAALTTWAVVNLVNVLQAIGFVSRIVRGSMRVQRRLGYAMMVLGLPAAITLVAFLRAGSHWLQWLGLVLYLAFLVFLISVDYLWQVEFRSPPRPSLLVPFLLLFFGSILLMGLPMFGMDRDRWLVTVGTTVLLLVSMGFAMKKGVG
jgi:hypothetical protein